MIKAGRNDPCPCGSGEKYKRCCLTNNEPAPNPIWEEGSVDSEWLKIRRTEGEFIPKLMKFARDRLGPDGLLEAWSDFTSSEDAINNHSDFEAAFIPWFCFNHETEFDGKSIARSYLEYHLEKLSPYQIKYIIAATRENFSFYLILDAQPGLSLHVKDVLLDREFTVKERQGSHQLKPGNLVFGRVLTVEDQSVFFGMTTLIIPSKFHFDILDFRDHLKKNAKKESFPFDFSILTEYDYEIRDFYWEIREMLLNPPPPIVKNTDGDLMEWTTMHFTLNCSTEIAHEKLATLSLEAFRDPFKRNGENVIVWQKKGNKKHASYTNTNLGTIEIKENSLIAETNSKKRSRTLKREIETRLKDDALFVKSNSLSLQEMLDKKSTSSSDPESPPLDVPESMITELNEKHWNAWFDIKIPALKNKSPREAAKTVAGRERLEALLMHYDDKKSTHTSPQKNIFAPNVAEIRKKLGL